MGRHHIINVEDFTYKFHINILRILKQLYFHSLRQLYNIFNSQDRHHSSVCSLHLSACHSNNTRWKTFTADVVIQMHQWRHHMTACSFSSLVLLSRVSLLTSVRLSVHNVPVPVSDENGLTYHHSFSTIRLPNHSVFISIKHLHEIPTGSPHTRALNTGGV